ncbi:hypothetical protein LG302_19720 [Halomonas organivorans]
MKRSMNGRLHRRLALGMGVATVAFSMGCLSDEGVTAGAGFDTLTGMGTDELDDARGREGVEIDLVNVQSVQDMDARTSGSSFNVTNGDMVSGAITYETGAMGHYSGTGIFNNVTGNANAINNAIGISVYISNP